MRYVFFGYVLVSLAAIALPLRAAAQSRSALAVPKLEELPAVPVDTIDTVDPDTRIILYSNNTFEYHRPALEDRYSDLMVFNEHWETTQVFAYKSVELRDLPDEVDIRLISGLGEFHWPYLGKVSYKFKPSCIVYLSIFRAFDRDMVA